MIAPLRRPMALMAFDSRSLCLLMGNRDGLETYRSARGLDTGDIAGMSAQKNLTFARGLIELVLVSLCCREVVRVSDCWS